LIDFFLSLSSPSLPHFWNTATEVPLFDFVLFLVLILGLTSIFLYLDLKKSEKKAFLFQRQVQRKGLLISSLTHDLSNSLLVMEMSSQQFSKTENQAKPLLRLQQSIAHQRFLLNAVKNLQLYYRKLLKPTLTSMDPLEALKKALSTFESLIEQRRLKIQWETQDSSLIQAESSLLTTGLFQSLLQLMFKNIPDESTLKIEALAQDHEVQMSLKSTFCCITPEQLLQWQLDDEDIQARLESSEPGKSNLDIGFLQAQALVKFFKGRLQVITDEEKGTEFKIFFSLEH